LRRCAGLHAGSVRQFTDGDVKARRVVRLSTT
jgi:hypothetical protein